jgi:hypothetical protein
MYDPTIGRWSTPDPVSHWAENLTPYRYGFNNPVLYIDPNGLFETKAEAEKYAANNKIKTGFFRRNKIRKQDDGTFAINNRRSDTSTFQDKSMANEANKAGVFTAALVIGEGPSLTQVWSDAMSTESDANSIGFGADAAFGGGFGFDVSAVRINRGEDQGWHFYGTFNLNVGHGGGAGVNVSAIDFNDDNSANKVLNAGTFAGKGNAYSGGLGIVGANYSWTPSDGQMSFNPKKGNVYSTKGAGLSAGVNAGMMWQRTYTKLFGN